jgi:hypothetical protein
LLSAAIGSYAHALTVDDTHQRSDESWTQDTAGDGDTVCVPYTLAHHEQRVAAGEADAWMWDDLLAAGWVGVAGDGGEALWAPECAGQ